LNYVRSFTYILGGYTKQCQAVLWRLGTTKLL